MSFEQFTDFFSWLNEHPHWVGLLVFLTALTESLVIVGLIVPGFIMMVGFGALIATGVLEFWPTTLYATAGAFFGDSLSYWLGHRYQHQLARVWPLNRHPHLMTKGEKFFERYGALSIVAGRFFGPLRAIVPAIAGMSNMSRVRFFIANLMSAMAWAPLYLLPGILFGMSIELAKEFAGQFAIFLAVVFIFFILSFVIIKTIYTWIAPQTDVLMYRLLIWSRQHPTGGKVSESLINSQQSEIRALTILGLMLLGAVITWFAMTHWLLDARFFSNLDVLVFNLFQKNHIPLLDSFFYGFALLGERASITILYILLILYFSLTGRLSIVLYCLAALILPWITANLIDISYVYSILKAPHQIVTHWHESGLFFIDICALGFLSVLLGRNAGSSWRGFVYLSISMICLLIALSQLYFGIQWLSEIVGGLLLGIIWVSVLSIAFRCHIQDTRNHHPTVFSLSLLLLLVTLPFLVAQTELVSRYKPAVQASTELVMSRNGWFESGWQIVPHIRHDLSAERTHPFTIQWHGSEQMIVKTMTNAKWKYQENRASDFFRWMQPDVELDKLPVLPHVHNGEYSQLHFTRIHGNRILILRLWRSSLLLQDSAAQQPAPEPLWFGTITYSIRSERAYMNYLVSDLDFSAPAVELQRNLSKLDNIQMEVIKTESVKPFLLLVSKR